MRLIQNYSDSLDLNKNLFVNLIKHKNEGIFLISTEKNFIIDLNRFSEKFLYKKLMISQVLYYINFFYYFGNAKPHIRNIRLSKSKKKIFKKNILEIFFNAKIMVNYEYFLEFFLLNNFQKVINDVYNTKIGMFVKFSEEKKNTLIIKLINFHYILPFLISNFDYDLQISEIIFEVYGNEAHLLYLFKQLNKINF